jgi:K+/H+ antiporter YhaU regulatory subunit KhtT
MPQLWAFGPTSQASQAGDSIQLVDAVNQSTQTARDAIQQLVTQRDALIVHQTELIQQVQVSQDRLESLTESVAKQKAEAASVVAVVQQMYAEKEAERITAFSTLLQELRADFAKLQIESEKTQSERLESLKTSQDQAAQIVQVVGNTGITGNYQKIANVEGTQADVWRWITIAFFASGIALAGATFWKFWHEPFSPETAWSVLIRLMYAVAITSPAWYTAKESARHRSNADRARQTELELASLGPFIELMPEEKKHQIREELTKHYFGNQTSEHTSESPISFQKLSDVAIELMKAAKSDA